MGYIFRFWSLSPLLRRSSFRVQICGESTLGLNLRDLSVFFLFWNFYLNNASSVGQTRCNCSDHLFIRGVFSTQPIFQSMEPTGACQVYILPRYQATSIFDKKIWRKKNQDCEIFWEAIYCIINRLPLDETGKHGPFPVLQDSCNNLTTNMFRVCKNSSGICHH